MAPEQPSHSLDQRFSQAESYEALAQKHGAAEADKQASRDALNGKTIEVRSGETLGKKLLDACGGNTAEGRKLMFSMLAQITRAGFNVDYVKAGEKFTFSNSEVKIKHPNGNETALNLDGGKQEILSDTRRGTIETSREVAADIALDIYNLYLAGKAGAGIENWGKEKEVFIEAIVVLLSERVVEPDFYKTHYKALHENVTKMETEHGKSSAEYNLAVVELLRKVRDVVKTDSNGMKELWTYVAAYMGATEEDRQAIKGKRPSTSPGSSSLEATTPVGEPEAVTVQPEAVSVQPEAVSVQPEAVSVQPEAVSVQPEVVSVQPEAVSVQPEAVSVQPEAVSVQPEAVSVQPEAVSTEAPTAVTEAPAEVTEAPAEVTEAPAEVTEAPAEVTEAPAEVTEAPAEVTEAPAEVTEPPAEVDTPEPSVEPLPKKEAIQKFEKMSTLYFNTNGTNSNAVTALLLSFEDSEQSLENLPAAQKAEYFRERGYLKLQNAVLKFGVETVFGGSLTIDSEEKIGTLSTAQQTALKAEMRAALDDFDKSLALFGSAGRLNKKEKEQQGKAVSTQKSITDLLARIDEAVVQYSESAIETVEAKKVAVEAYIEKWYPKSEVTVTWTDRHAQVDIKQGDRMTSLNYELRYDDETNGVKVWAPNNFFVDFSPLHPTNIQAELNRAPFGGSVRLEAKFPVEATPQARAKMQAMGLSVEQGILLSQSEGIVTIFNLDQSEIDRGLSRKGIAAGAQTPTASMDLSVEGSELVISGEDEGGETWSYRGSDLAALKKNMEEVSQAKMQELKRTYPLPE